VAELLVSFCRPAVPGVAFARLDFESGGLEWLTTPSLAPESGGMGLLRHGTHIYGLATRPLPDRIGSLLLRFDDALAERGSWPLRSVVNGHGLAADGGALLANSTGTEEVVRIEVCRDGGIEERVVWSAGSGTDERHVNGLAVAGERMFVSGFGRRRNGSWTDTDGGYVRDVFGGRDVCRGLTQPHSLFHLDGRLCVLESMGGRILDIAGDTPVTLGRVDGYARGIAIDASFFYVATSRARKRSKYTGERREIIPRSRCEIHRIDRRTGEVTVRPLYEHGAEIFDLLVLTATT
jgi:hypothetical protein